MWLDNKRNQTQQSRKTTVTIPENYEISAEVSENASAHFNKMESIIQRSYFYAVINIFKKFSRSFRTKNGKGIFEPSLAY